MSTIPKEEGEFKNKVMDIMKDYIHFAPQVDGYVVHGAIDKIWELHQLATDGREESHIQNFKNMTERCNNYHDQITALQSSLKYTTELWKSQMAMNLKLNQELNELNGQNVNLKSSLKEKEKECEELKQEIKYWEENQLEWRRNSDGKAQLLRQQSREIEELKAENERLRASHTDL